MSDAVVQNKSRISVLATVVKNLVVLVSRIAMHLQIGETASRGLQCHCEDFCTRLTAVVGIMTS